MSTVAIAIIAPKNINTYLTISSDFQPPMQPPSPVRFCVSPADRRLGARGEGPRLPRPHEPTARPPPKPHSTLETLPTRGETAAPRAAEGLSAYLYATPQSAAPPAPERGTSHTSMLRLAPQRGSPHTSQVAVSPNHPDRRDLSDGAGGFSPGDPTPTAGRRTSTASGFIRGEGPHQLRPSIPLIAPSIMVANPQAA